MSPGTTRTTTPARHRNCEEQLSPELLPEVRRPAPPIDRACYTLPLETNTGPRQRPRKRGTLQLTGTHQDRKRTERLDLTAKYPWYIARNKTGPPRRRAASSSSRLARTAAAAAAVLSRTLPPTVSGEVQSSGAFKPSLGARSRCLVCSPWLSLCFFFPVIFYGGQRT